MGSYLLPLTINNRRLYSLPLHTENHGTTTEDFVIELKPHTPKLPLISIDKSKVLQTLHIGKSDIKLENLKSSIAVVDERIHLLFDIAIKPKQAAGITDKMVSDTRFGTPQPVDTPNVDKNNEDFELEHLGGLEIGFEENDLKYFIFLINPSGKSHFLNNNKLEIEISFKNGNAEYKNMLNLFISPENSFLQFGFDFGSEASQIRQRRYVKNGFSFSEELKDPSLFNIVKDYKGGSNDNDSSFFQYEEDTGFLKSIFFAKKALINNTQKNDDLLEDKEGVLILKKTQEADANFYNEWTQLPNLKIAHKYGDELGGLKFRIASGTSTQTKTLEELKKKLYASILNEILESYLLNLNFHQKSDIRITMLIPNIYDTDDISYSKYIVKKIVNEINESKLDNAIRSCEIITLSESDAAFMGYYNSAGTSFAHKNNFYIIIDCGKGTTDFSVVQTDEESIFEYKNIYRNGFAGAGNCITFAFFESFFYYIISITSKKEKAREYLTNFFQSIVGGQKETLFAILEKYKLNYSPQRSRKEIEDEYKGIKSGDITFRNFFEKDIEPEVLFDLMSKCTSCFDWNGYISTTVNEITELIMGNLSPIIKSLSSKKINCGGILLTGRGILFTPLDNSVRNAFAALSIQPNKIQHPRNSKDYKTVCLQGVFKDSYVYNPDIMCMPIEFAQEIPEIKQTTKVKSMSEKLSGLLKSLLEGDIGFDQENNSLKVQQNEIEKLRFIIGNYFYEPSNYKMHNSKNMELIFDGQRFILRSFANDETLHEYCVLKKDSRLNTDDNHHVIASLFPSIINAKKINFLTQNFPSDDPFDLLMPMPRI